MVQSVIRDGRRQCGDPRITFSFTNSCKLSKKLTPSIDRAALSRGRPTLLVRDSRHDVHECLVLDGQHAVGVLGQLGEREEGVVGRGDDIVVLGGEDRHGEAVDVREFVLEELQDIGAQAGPWVQQCDYDIMAMCSCKAQ